MGDGYPFGIYPCADGHLGVSILTQGHWDGLCRLMDRPDLLDHPRYRTGVERARPEIAAEIDVIIAEWAKGQPALETFQAGQAIRAPIAIVPSPTEVLASPHYAARHYWVDYDDAELGPLRLPGTPFRLASGAFAPFTPAGVVGAGTDGVLKEAATA
jgi:crotonobetainyl-CoA:carnitine CoA-transferase CaiB-like acyl-CoA transferase